MPWISVLTAAAAGGGGWGRVWPSRSRERLSVSFVLLLKFEHRWLVRCAWFILKLKILTLHWWEVCCSSVKAPEENRLWDFGFLGKWVPWKKSSFYFFCLSESVKNVNQSPKLTSSNVLFCLTNSPKQHIVTLEKLRAEDVSSSCRLISQPLNKGDSFYDRALETWSSSSQEPAQAWDAL